jgi:pentatricopeptide repeat protein
MKKYYEKKEKKMTIEIYNQILNIFSINNKYELTEYFLKEMEENQIKLDIYTYSILIKIFIKNSKNIDKILIDMKKNKIEPNIETYNTLISEFINKKEFEKALSVVSSLKLFLKPNLFTFNLISKIYQLYKKDYFFVIQSYKEMESLFIQHDLISFNNIIHTFIHLNDLDSALGKYIYIFKN